MIDRNYFDRVVLINLKRRPDRLASVRKLLAVNWPFLEPDIFQAVDGSKVPSPFGWRMGGGTWGCLQSHRRVLEKAIMDDVKSLLVLEDDICIEPTFLEEVEKFLLTVPGDWDQLMLGGQHINGPTPVKPGVVRCTNCQRTHAYAVRGRFLRDLYAKWCSHSTQTHCDHIMGPFQRSYQVYAPDPFIFGQDRSKSDISGAINPRKFWKPPAKDAPAVLLRASREVMEELRGYGFHGGFTRNTDGYDVGLVAALADKNINSKLRQWIDMILWEVASGNGAVATIWHPNVTPEMIAKAWPGRLIQIEADTVEDALAMLPKIGLQEGSENTKPIVLLEATPPVVTQLRATGWHTGYWRDEITDLDNGLRKLVHEGTPVEALGQFIQMLISEAEAITNGVAAVWYPGISVDKVRKAAGERPVLLIQGGTLEEIIQKFENLLKE